MPKGGKREGAGRPKGTGKFNTPTMPIRVPYEFAAAWYNPTNPMAEYWQEIMDFYWHKLTKEKKQ